MLIKNCGTNGIHLTLDNGITVSIQYGVRDYCYNRDLDSLDLMGRDELEACSNCEVAFWNGDGGMLKLSHGDNVAGNVPVDKIMHFVYVSNTLTNKEAIELITKYDF